MRNGFLVLAAVLLGLMGLEASAVQVTDNFSIGGWVWIMDRQELTSGNPSGVNKSGMDVDEAELDAAWKIDSTWTANVGFLMGRWAEDANEKSDMGPGAWVIKRGNVEGKGLWGDGSKLVVGLQGSPYVVHIEGPWNMNWLDGYTLGLQDGGFYFRHENGLLAGGKVGEPMFYDVFVHSGEGFDHNSIKNDSAYAATADVGYEFMHGGTAYLQYEVAPAAAGYGSHTTASATVMLKGALPIDILAEFVMADGKNKDGNTTGYSSFPKSGYAAGVPSFHAQAYALHLNYHFNETVGLWARYVSGNNDYVDKLGGVQYGQWGPSFPATAKTTAVKSRISVGPTYTIVKDRLMSALVYETGTLSSKAKDDPTLKADGITTVSAVRLNVAAFF